jgi:hypothetical protein
MGKRKIGQLAEAIARDLFTCGTGEVVDRLALMVDRPVKADLGGWSYLAVVDRITKILADEAVAK